MKNDLIERYIYAVTKKLPKKTREDVVKELETLIDDMLEERCKDVTPTEKDIKVVLTELGTPQELSAKYHPDSEKQLIGGTYYPAYKLVLTIVMISIAGGLLIAEGMAFVIGDIIWYEALFGWIGSTLVSLACGFAVVTILFAIFERKGVAVNIANNSIDSLPPVPQKNQVIKRVDPILGIIITVIFVIYFLAMPGFIAISFDGTDFGYLFNPEYVKSIWYIIVALAVVGIIKESFRLFEGKYTKKLAVGTLVCNIISAILTVAFLWNDKIINPEFGKFFLKIFDGDLDFISGLFTNFNMIFMGFILFALLLDIIVTAVKALRYDK